MASRFNGRDYSTLRSELINFLKSRFPSDWDYTNLSDPAVIIAESLARIGDQLHFTIDELRRECDISTAQRTSSIYSYALREGYNLMLPKGSSGMITLNSSNSDRHIKLEINKFDEIGVKNSNLKLFAGNSINADLQPIPSAEDYEKAASEVNNLETEMQYLLSRTQRLQVVLGEKYTFHFSYYDINTNFTVDLPEAFIDRDLFELTVKKINNSEDTPMRYVKDVIAAGFAGNIYSLTPKFIGGQTSLSIEFPSNYKDIFNETDTFSFTYISISNESLSSDTKLDLLSGKYIKPSLGYELDSEGRAVTINEDDFIVNMGNGVKGYTSYENPKFTRENYKRFIQDYSALLTKDDYLNYVKASTMSKCKVFDISDNYNGNVSSFTIPERTIYIITDTPYTQRESLFYSLQERSSRSDCIAIVPFGKDPYIIVLKAECFLLGTSASAVSTSIKSALINYFNDPLEDRIPQSSMINYIAHSASKTIGTVQSYTVRDTKFGRQTSDFDNVLNLTNNEVDEFYNKIKDPSSEGLGYGGEVVYKRVIDDFPVLTNVSNIDTKYTTYESILQNTQRIYGVYDSISVDYKDRDIITDDGSIDEFYKAHHYMQPTLSKVVVLIKAINN